jgi:hypothetical protein
LNMRTPSTTCYANGTVQYINYENCFTVPVHLLDDSAALW